MRLSLIIIYSLFALPLIGQTIKNKAEKEIFEHFNQYVTFSFEKFQLPNEIKAEIVEECDQKFFRNEVYHWEVFENDSLIAHAFLDNVMGRTQPITFLAIVGLDGKILHNSIVKYRSHKGGAVQNRSWLDQFIGKTKENNFRVGNEIQAVSGATYSVKSLTKGFKKLLVLYDKVFKNKL